MASKDDRDSNWIVLVGSAGEPPAINSKEAECIPPNDACGSETFADLNSDIQAFLFKDYPVYYPIKRKFKMVYEETMIGVCWDLWVVALSMVVFGFFVCVIDRTTYAFNYLGPGLDRVEAACNCFFLLDFLFRWYIYGDHSGFYLSLDAIPEPWVDVVSFIPYLIGRRRISVNFGFARSARILRLLRPNGCLDTFNPNMGSLSRTLLQTALSVCVAMLVTSGLVQLFEGINFVKGDYFHPSDYTNCAYIGEATNWTPSCYPDQPIPADDLSCDCDNYNCVAFRTFPSDPLTDSIIRCEPWSWFDALWFMIVTATTVGYGDEYPVTTYGRLIVIFFILWFLFYIQKVVSDVNNLFQGNARYLVHQPTPKKGQKLVLIVGQISDKAQIIRVLMELYTSNRASSKGANTVLVAPHPPSNDIIDVLNMDQFRGKVNYIMGSALSAEDLIRVSAPRAEAVFILSDSQASNFDKEDTRAIITTLAVENCNPNIRTFSQVLQKSNKGLVNEDADFVVCFQELRAAMLAMSALVPGSACLITNLFTSVESSVFKKTRKPWLKEYVKGMENEIFFVKITSLKVWDAIKNDYLAFIIWMFIRFSVVVVGIVSVENPNSMIVNPAEIPERTGEDDEFDSLVMICPHERQAMDVKKHLDEQNRKSLIKSLTNLHAPSVGATASSRKTSASRKTSGASLSRTYSTRSKAEFSISEVYGGPSRGTAPRSFTKSFASKSSKTKSYTESMAQLKELFFAGKMTGHAVIIGDFESAKHLIPHLRKEQYRGTNLWKPLVIAASEVSDEDEEEASLYPNVIVVPADTSHYRFLMEKADSCVILKSTGKEIKYSEFELGQDGYNIMKFLRMSDMVSPSFICLELINQDSVGVLTSTIIRREESGQHMLIDIETTHFDAKSSSSKGTGGRSSPRSLKAGLLDNAQDWNSPSPLHSKKNRAPSVSIQEEKKDHQQKAEKKQNDPDEQGYNKKELYASGTCYLPFLKDKLIVQAFLCTHTAVVCDALLRGGKGIHSNLFLAKIPDEYFRDEADFNGGTSFTWIFSCFLKKRMCLAIGLYRAKSDTNEAGLSYVYTCPDPSTVVTCEDRVYLLGAKEEIIDLVGKETRVIEG